MIALVGSNESSPRSFSEFNSQSQSTAMSSGSQEMARVIPASGVGNAFVNKSLLTMPRPPLVTNAFVTDHMQIAPDQDGSARPGSTAVFQIPLQTDCVRALTLAIELNEVTLGTATAVTHHDYFALACLRELRLIFGTQRLITVRRDEIYAKMNHYMQDEDRNKRRELMGGGLTPLQRQQRALASRQWFYLPLDYLLGLHLGAPPSLAIHQRMLGEKLRVEVDFEPAANLVTTDGTYTYTGTGAALANTPVESAWFNNVYLYAEGEHYLTDARLMLQKLYSQQRRYLFRLAQPVNRAIVAGTTALSAANTARVDILNVTMPVVSLWCALRWDLDLTRSNTGAGTGRDYFNYGGWYNPGGSTTNTGVPIVEFVEGTVGTSASFQRRVPVEHLIKYEAARRWKGSGVFNGAAPIIQITWSQEPSQENAVFGFTDFTQLDRSTLILTFSGQSGNATINAAATVDIGANSDLAIDVNADCFSVLNFANNQIAKPFA